MNEDFAAAMRRATVAVRGGQPGEATAIIRAALGKRETNAPASEVAAAPVHDVQRHRRSVGQQIEMVRAPASDPLPSERVTFPLGDVIATLKSRRAQPSRGRNPADLRKPADARFQVRTFDGSGGSRDYRLYVPATMPGGPAGLIVMLHGCNQDPDDFAAGTDMNRLAETHGLIVAYPEQTRRANMSACWNWFDSNHQRRDAGEPAILAGLAAALRDEFAVAPTRVFVAGLSAGGAMAAVMAATYPDLFAAAGIHSGLGYGAASDVMSAFSAMNGGGAPLRAAMSTDARPRVIIVHGTADTTVAPSNAASIFDAMEELFPAGRRSVERIGGSATERSELVHRLERDGVVVAEMRLVEGMGHAWAGGSEAGSYTDPAGPDASAAMIRFFLAADSPA